jgi:hypothetical protein
MPDPGGVLKNQPYVLKIQQWRRFVKREVLFAWLSVFPIIDLSDHRRRELAGLRREDHSRDRRGEPAGRRDLQRGSEIYGTRQMRTRYT